MSFELNEKLAQLEKAYTAAWYRAAGAKPGPDLDRAAEERRAIGEEVQRMRELLRQKNFIFFDSNGWAWETCQACNLDAVAFGPTGVAHILTPSELEVMNLYSETQTPWAVAQEQGRLVRGDPDNNEWDTLAE